MWPSRRPLNHCRVIHVNLPLNILQWITFVPQEMIIWPLNAVRCFSRSFTLVKTILGIMYCGGTSASMIAYENGLGRALGCALGTRSLVERWSSYCRFLCNSSLALRNSSLFSRKASIFAIIWFCLSKSSTRAFAIDFSYSALASTISLSYSTLASIISLSCSALASRWIHFCSRLYCSLASWKTFTVSISCCRSGASFASSPSGTCLVFLTSLENSHTTVDGIKFYRAPRWASNLLASWLCRWLTLVKKI